MPAPVRLIVNPSAGGGRAARVAPIAQQALLARGLTVVRDDTRDIGHARELARRAAAEGQTVVTVSGDGLIGVVADELRHLPGSLLGIVPGGRGNDLARVLGIPEDPAAAAAVVAEGHARPVDLGLVQDAAGSCAFVGIASAGFDSDANRIANEAPSWLGGLVYAYGALRALAAWRPARFDIELDPPGQRLSLTGYSVGAANSKAYGGGMKAAPGAMLDDGLLDIVVLERASKLAFLTRILPKVFSGAHVNEPCVKSFRAREVAISSDRPFTMYADGDPIGQLPLRVRSLPGAVTMLLPRVPPADSAFAAEPDAASPAPPPAASPR